MNKMKEIFRWLTQYPIWVLRTVKLFLGFKTLKDIKMLSIEFSSVCNLCCRYCFLDQLDRTKFLDINVYEKLIKEVAENPAYNIRIIDWPISGEFLVYREWKRAVEITKKYMDANSHFRPHIILNENFMLFDPQKVDDLLRANVVRQIIFSLDGVDPASFERMRPPAKFNRCAENFRYLVKRNNELGHPVHLQINNGRDDECAGQEYSPEFRELFALAHSITQWRPKYWNESFNKPDQEFYPARGFCMFVHNNVTLISSGHIGKCTLDLRGQTAYNDLNTKTLKEIWHSAQRKDYLKKMLLNKRRGIPGCETCSVTATNNDNRYNNVYKSMKRSMNTFIKGKDYYLEPCGK